MFHTVLIACIDRFSELPTWLKKSAGFLFEWLYFCCILYKSQLFFPGSSPSIVFTSIMHWGFEKCLLVNLVLYSYRWDRTMLSSILMVCFWNFCSGGYRCLHIVQACSLHNGLVATPLNLLPHVICIFLLIYRYNDEIEEQIIDDLQNWPSYYAHLAFSGSPRVIFKA